MNIQSLLSLPREKRLYDAILHLNPVAYYPLNELRSSIALNHAPQTRYTLNGTVTGAIPGQPGKCGKAYSFDGDNDNINISDNAILNFGASTDFSLFCLFRTGVTGTDKLLIGKGSGASTYKLRIGSGNNLFVTIGDGTAISSTGGGSVCDDKWHIGAASFDRDGNAQVYLDGYPYGNALNISGEGNIDVAQALRIGENVGGTADYNGFLQHCGILNRIMSVSEMLNIARLVGFV